MDFDVSYDVAVIGAGIAGVAAAVQAAREHKKTVLIEKTILPGGLATTGLVYIYLPICDGNGHQVSFGITEELLQRSVKYGPGIIPDWAHNGKNLPEVKRYRCIFSPAAYMLALDEYLTENGVDVWYDTLICDAEVSNGKVSAAICENESGRGRISAKCFVDASGSCILARRAGIPCHDDYNYLSIWALHYKKAENPSDLGQNVQISMYGVPWDVNKAPADCVYRGLTGKTVTDFVMKSRRMLLDEYRKAWKTGISEKDFYALKLPAMPQFRKIYSLDTEYVLDSGENNKHFDDSIGMCADWRKSGPVWEIPYRSLYPANHVGGILAAGRCSGAKNDAWEVTRVIPVAGLTGQVAGLAASMSIDEGIEPYELDHVKLQNKLRDLGFKLHLEEVGLLPE